MKFGIPSYVGLYNIGFKCSLYYSKSKFRFKNPTFTHMKLNFERKKKEQQDKNSLLGKITLCIS